MISTKEGTTNYSKAGITKGKMSIPRMFVLAIMAGMFIAFAGVASTAAAVSVQAPSIAKLVTALIFPAGLAMVIINGTELFTGNNLMIISVLNRKESIKQMFRNWTVVYIGNFLGSLLVTGLCTLGHVYSMFDNQLAASVVSTAVTKCNLSFSDAFIKAILCNILVCLAVIMTMMSDSLAGKIAALYFPIMVFVICGFEHSVANMSYISGGIFVDMFYGNLGIDTTGLTWFDFLIGNMVPVTLGNMVGGCATGIACWYTNIHRTN
ncbi:MAG: formate/nitrite transporter family protein [Eubacterium sp.]